MWLNVQSIFIFYSFLLKIFRFLLVHYQLLLVIRSVFKKRPNFLNSAPTSTESALRLLSAPSIRFWQQTAICPVSLWALVVELHPLNWARAQAVCRISDNMTMKEFEVQRARVCVCVCVCVCIYINFYIHQTYGKDCMSRTQCYEWFNGLDYLLL
jgi:hypothetical protein